MVNDVTVHKLQTAHQQTHVCNVSVHLSELRCTSLHFRLWTYHSIMTRDVLCMTTWFHSSNSRTQISSFTESISAGCQIISDSLVIPKDGICSSQKLASVKHQTFLQYWTDENIPRKHTPTPNISFWVFSVIVPSISDTCCIFSPSLFMSSHAHFPLLLHWMTLLYLLLQIHQLIP